MKIWQITILAIMLAYVTNTYAASVSGQGTWESTLQGRDLDGNTTTVEAYYDTVLDITWLADTIYGLGSIYAVSDGRMSLPSATEWIANLNPYGSGITGWRLPSVQPINGTASNFVTYDSFFGTNDSGYNISAPGSLYAGSTASELAHMYYNTLGNWAFCDPSADVCNCDFFTDCTRPGSGLTNTGPFSNLVTEFYWATTPNSSYYLWVFNTIDGWQEFEVTPEYRAANAWAVHTGDVGASLVPAPAAAWLLSSGLIGLFGMAKRKTKT